MRESHTPYAPHRDQPSDKHPTAHGFPLRGRLLHRPPRTIPRVALLLSALAILACGPQPQAQKGERVADLKPLSKEILELWKTADLICLGEIHGSPWDAALRQALIALPTFPEVVDVIIVEFANGQHQELLDRLVLQGEDLSRDDLRPIWLDAGLGQDWDRPMYEAFLRAVAKTNRAKPLDTRVQVIAGALAIDWASIREPEDLDPWRDRPTHFATIWRREVLQPGKKGLAIYGAGHCERRPPSPFAQLLAEAPGRIWSILPFEGASGVEAGRRALNLDPKRLFQPRLLRINGTPLAKIPSGEMLFAGHRHIPLGDLSDSLAYPGSQDTRAQPPPDLSTQPALATELRRRTHLWLTPPQPGPAPPSKGIATSPQIP